MFPDTEMDSHHLLARPEKKRDVLDDVISLPGALSSVINLQDLIPLLL